MLPPPTPRRRRTLAAVCAVLLLVVLIAVANRPRDSEAVSSGHVAVRERHALIHLRDHHPRLGDGQVDEVVDQAEAVIAAGSDAQKKALLPKVQGTAKAKDHDSSTLGLLAAYHKLRN